VDILRAVLDKANGRVTLARKKVIALRKEDDDARAKTKAGDENMEVGAEPKGELLNYTSLSFIGIWLMLSILQNQRVQHLTIRLWQLATSLKAYTNLTREQKTVLARTLDGFISRLTPAARTPHANPHARRSYSRLRRSMVPSCKLGTG
jgi:nuclear cap-binding protein subunit 1